MVWVRRGCGWGDTGRRDHGASRAIHGKVAGPSYITPFHDIVRHLKPSRVFMSPTPVQFCDLGHVDSLFGRSQTEDSRGSVQVESRPEGLSLCQNMSSFRAQRVGQVADPDLMSTDWVQELVLEKLVDVLGLLAKNCVALVNDVGQTRLYVRRTIVPTVDILVL